MSPLNKTLQRRYGKLFREVRRIINEEDPIELKGRLPLDAEYEPEVAAILSHVNECRSLDELHRMIFTTFVQKFDRPVAGPPSRYLSIAKKIADFAKIPEKQK